MRRTSLFNRGMLAAFLALLPCVFTTVWAQQTVPPPDSGSYGTYDDLVKRYDAAVRDAEKLRFSKNDDHLTLISRNNAKQQWKEIQGESYVLLVVYTARPYKVSETEPAPIPSGAIVWTSAAPDLKDWCRTHRLAPNTLSLRLKQLMGMPPDVSKPLIVEMWVRPQDLRRPSFDPSIAHQIDLSTQTSDVYTPKGDAAYNSWFYQQCAQSYVMPATDLDRYPWTRLGYTYDWANPEFPHIGLSEFIIFGGEKVQVYIRSVKSPEEYCLGKK